MNLPLSYALDAVMTDAVNTDLFVSLCTIQQPDNLTIEAGSPSGNYVVVLSAIPCTAAPPSLLRIAATNMKTPEQVEGQVFDHVLLNGYYPQIPQFTQLWQAIIDGVTFDLLGAEHDSQSRMTRLNIRSTAE